MPARRWFRVKSGLDKPGDCSGLSSVGVPLERERNQLKRHGAGFVDEHKRNATRWDLARLVAALGNELTWDIAGSALDPFEPRQIRAARERLDPTLVRIHNLPGGHLTTHEHPDLLADLIRALPRRGENVPGRLAVGWPIH